MAARPPDARPSIGSIASIGSIGSILSINSIGSMLSIGSTGSIASVGSAGCIASIGSAGSIASIGSSGSIGSIGGSRRLGRWRLASAIAVVAVGAATIGTICALRRATAVPVVTDDPAVSGSSS